MGIAAFSERPSTLPATVAFGGLNASDHRDAAFLSTRLLASTGDVVEGRSVSAAGPVVSPQGVEWAYGDRCAALRGHALGDTAPNGHDRNRPATEGVDLIEGNGRVAKQAATAQQFVSKQISVMSVYRTTGVGGVPPRGRPS